MRLPPSRFIMSLTFVTSYAQPQLPETLRIPHGSFKNIPANQRRKEYQDARTDSRKGSGDGSPLYIVNKWAFRWGM